MEGVFEVKGGFEVAPDRFVFLGNDFGREPKPADGIVEGLVLFLGFLFFLLLAEDDRFGRREDDGAVVECFGLLEVRRLEGLVFHGGSLEARFFFVLGLEEFNQLLLLLDLLDVLQIGAD